MNRQSMTRRQFGGITAGVLTATVAGGGCQAGQGQGVAGLGRITARPSPDATTAAAETSRLGLHPARDAILHIPAGARAPLPLLVMLHGAGGQAEEFLKRFDRSANAAGVAMLVPDSRDSTWDAIRSSFGHDVLFLNSALERVFKTVAIDPERLALGGFSDGASYALSLGLINGDLFRRIVAFSPGFIVGGTPQGKPRCFVSHGVKDEILPIDRCGRRVVAQLQRGGYDVTYREFDGGHHVPANIAAEAFAWIAKSSSTR